MDAYTVVSKLIDLATAIVDGHRLLPKHPQSSPEA